jgi:hypothetical protein
MADSDGVSSTPMIEIEATLRGANGKVAADSLIARIDQLIQKIETYKNSAPPDEYSRLETVNKALAAARGIVLGISPG